MLAQINGAQLPSNLLIGRQEGGRERGSGITLETMGEEKWVRSAVKDAVVGRQERGAATEELSVSNLSLCVQQEWEAASVKLGVSARMVHTCVMVQQQLGTDDLTLILSRKNRTSKCCHGDAGSSFSHLAADLIIFIFKRNKVVKRSALVRERWRRQTAGCARGLRVKSVRKNLEGDEFGRRMKRE